MRLAVALLLALAACDSGAPALPDRGTDADGDGWTAEGGDCDDGDASVRPDTPEIWYDGVDQDCSGGSDTDRDGDGVDGGPSGADCDDTDPLVLPGAPERCDGVDDDCDGAVDEDPVDPVPLYTDADGDGFGAGDAVGTACVADAGTATTLGDCDDLDLASAPGQPERCDGADNDCNGGVDDAPQDGFPVYADTDGDGYGDAAAGATACALEDGWSGTASDCDDADPLTFPTGEELCDSRDNDCDGTIDEAATVPRLWYPDADGDGHGVAAGSTASCTRPSGYADAPDDCDDTTAARSPAATETCDGVDQDCDGAVDDSPADGAWAYPDTDGDGRGDRSAGVVACTQPDGYLTDGTDCDDTRSDVSPDLAETCDGVDDDCDGATDERTATDTRSFYADADLDGFGAGTLTVTACQAPHGYAEGATDCDDTDARMNPGARERCDTLDNDCDGVVDEEVPDAPTWYDDADGDGYGAGAGTVSCETVADAAHNDLDCDDADAARRPGAAEVDNGADDDCDVLVDEDALSTGAVVISEVARQPYAGGTGTSTNVNVQWFEVYNPGAAAVDLAGWHVVEQDGDVFYLPPDEGLVVEPGGYLVLCYGSVGFADPGLCAWTWGDRMHGSPWFDDTFWFDRDEDLVALYAGTLFVDEVHWTWDDTATENWPRSATYSMRLDDDALDATANDDLHAWCNADKVDVWSADGSTYDDHGTPAAVNGSCD